VVIQAIVIATALVVALYAGRAILRTPAVLLLGRHGRALAPTALASVWLLGLLAGQVTGSLRGMSVTGAVVMVALAGVARRRFPAREVHGPKWTHLDWVMFLFIAVVFWAVDLWDIECHRAIAAQYLHGNIPPTAINDPRYPLAYHGVYDALVALVLSVAPIDLQSAMAVVSVACLALTFTNLQALSRMFFQTPRLAQLARALFVLGFGPVLIRCAANGWDVKQMHGHTAQPFVDLIFRRPAGLGFAFFTFALALIVPCFSRPGGLPPSRRATRGLVLLAPTLLLLPQMSEEAMLFLFVLLAPLALRRRLPAPTVGLLLGAALLGATQSGVLRGVLGHHSMATPTLGVVWPPRLPTWEAEQTGVSLVSRQAAGLYFLELGPVFLGALGVALLGRDPGRRIIGVSFLAGMAVAVFAGTGDWKRSDLDRFLLYGIPPVFMLAADLPDRVLRLVRRAPGTAASRGLVAAFGLVVCGPSIAYPAWHAGNSLRDRFHDHLLGGDLRRALDIVGPREPILTTLDRADELVQAGFIVIAPMETNSIAQVTSSDFDAYVRANAERAAWLFLPQDDARVAGHDPSARNGNYVLVRPSAPPSATPGAGSH
jgi:hypothetical protein